ADGGDGAHQARRDRRDLCADRGGRGAPPRSCVATHNHQQENDMDETTIDQMKHDAAEQAVAAAAQAAAQRARARALRAHRHQLARLEQRAALAENFIGRADGIASLAASQLSQVDPNLRTEILNERRAAITKRALEQVDELRASLHVEAEAARAEAEILGDTRR